MESFITLSIYDPNYLKHEAFWIAKRLILSHTLFPLSIVQHGASHLVNKDIPYTELDQLEQAIAALENQSVVLGNAVVDAALVSIRGKLSAFKETQQASQQRKLATILFKDIVSSTTITQDLDPEDIMTIIDTALRRLAAPAFDHGGRVTRFMGDVFLALFGVPLAHEKNPEMTADFGRSQDVCPKNGNRMANWSIPSWSRPLIDLGARVLYKLGL